MFEAQTEWISPDNFPDLSGYKLIAIDLETKDPDLKSKGSGAVVGNGEIIGVAVAVDGWCKYYPFGHEGGGNLDKKRILEWDGIANEIPTKDNKYILIDTFARWRISDALEFFKSAKNEMLAQSRLDDI